MAGTSLDKIKGLTYDDKETLQKAYISSVEELWAKIPRIGTLFKPADANRVMIECAKYAMRRSRFVTGGFLANHFLDFVILVALGLLVGAFGAFHHAPAVKSQKIIPAFHVINSDDIMQFGQGADRDSLNQILGRYSADAIPAEAVIDPSKLSRGRRLSNQLDGLRILNVTLQPTPLLSGSVPPVRLDLVGAGTKPDSCCPVCAVWLLDYRLQPDGLWAVIATSENAL